MSEEIKLYQVKAWVNGQEIIEDYSTYEEASKRFGYLRDEDPLCDAAYIYMEGRMTEAYDQAYIDYLDRAVEEFEAEKEAERRARGWG